MTFTQILLLAAAAAVVAERAEPTAHFILLATQRTGSTWVMSELSKHSSCIATVETRMVTYEDLSANATAFAQLANWLQGGGSKCPNALDSSREVDGPGARAVLKIHSKSLNETVLNWNVVVKTLTGTEFERFLHDDA